MSKSDHERLEEIRSLREQLMAAHPPGVSSLANAVPVRERIVISRSELETLINIAFNYGYAYCDKADKTEVIALPCVDDDEEWGDELVCADCCEHILLCECGEDS